MERLKDNRFDRQNNRRRLNFGPDHKEILENTVTFFISFTANILGKGRNGRCQL